MVSKRFSAGWSGSRRLLTMVSDLLLWVLVSLLAISLLNLSPLITLGLGLLGGALIAVLYVRERSPVARPIKLDNHEANGGTPNWKRDVVLLADHQLYLTALAAPFLLFATHTPTWLATASWTLLALPWLARLVTQRRLTRSTPTDPFFLALFIMAAVGFLVSIDRSKSMGYVRQLSVGAGMFYGLANLPRSRSSVILPFTGLFLVSTALALAAPLLVTWTSSRFVFEHAYRDLTPIVPESLDANIIAAIQSMSLLVLVALLWRGRLAPRDGAESEPTPKWVRPVLTAAALVMLAVLAFTQSRGGLFALTVGLCTLLVLYRSRFLLLIPIVGVGTFAAAAFLDMGIIADTLLSAGPARGWASRREVWTTALDMITAMPFTGVGIGTFAEIENLLFPIAQQWQPTHAHNLFLQVGVDLGIPGLVAYAGILSSCFLMAGDAWRTSQCRGDSTLEALSAGVLSSLVALVTHGLVDAPLWGNKPSVVAWFFMGLAALAYVQSRQASDRASISASPRPQ